MPLSPGDKLGPYEILEQIGAGGMGEVYRAHDARLRRDVAIKVSHERFSDRFEREARAVAALNHPNICTLYDVGPDYLVMELIEGESPKGPLPLDETLRIVHQIADALDAAHEKGIIHRDLKPGNIKIKPDGTVKVLDFGLAKTPELISGDPETSPTLTASPTRAGMIMGTASYMSPEQARGKTVDKRADIWAFGVVMYELLTGRRPFHGEDLTETLASVMKDKPDVSRVPVQVRRLLGSCLEKDPRKRLRDIGDAWRLLDDSSALPSPPTPTPRLIWAAGMLATIAVALGVFAFLRPTSSAEPFRLAINPPPGGHFDFANDTGGSAISPDGTRVAFVADGALWVRPLDSDTAIRLPATDGAYYPFWSPDLRSIAYFARDKLMRIVLPSGPIAELATLESGSARGGSWNADGTIIYAELVRPLFRVSSSGGAPVSLTSLDAARQENAHYHPRFLPDGNRFLYMIRSNDPANNGIYVGSLKDSKLKKKVANVLSNAAYVSAQGEYPGYLLFYREGALIAQPFEAKTLRSIGSADVISESVGYLLNNHFANFSVSDTGRVVLGTMGTPKVQMTWLDRMGKASAVPNPPDYFSFPRISPDGSRVVIQKGWNVTVAPWIFDFKRGVLSRVDEEGGRPVWSADSRRILYERGVKALVRKDLDSPQPAEIVARLAGGLGTAFDWSPDGQYAVVELLGGLTALSLDDHATSRQLTNGAKDYFPRFSADGKWLAYHSRQSDRYEVFVQDFPNGRTRTQVSNQGGVVPLWRRDQKELFYLTPNGGIMAADVRSSISGLEFGVPHLLFTSSSLSTANLGGADACDVTPDGQHFLCLLHIENEARDNQLTVINNWRHGAVR